MLFRSLFVARIQAGKLALEPDEVDLGAVVRRSVAEFEPRAATKGVALTCVVEPVPAVVADKGRIMQVLDNLVSNALKFTREGGTVHVSLSHADGVVRLGVTDTGIGIAPDDQRRLFERFFRATNAVEGEVPGTGLGLYIARAIAEAHGGSITAQSELGRGSTFCIELPAARAEAAVA